MSKKFSKLLLGAAVVGAAVGAFAYFNNKYNAEDEWDDDFDEFDDEFDEDDLEDEDTAASNEREYVTIPTDNVEKEISKEELS